MEIQLSMYKISSSQIQETQPNHIGLKYSLLELWDLNTTSSELYLQCPNANQTEKWAA